MNKKKIFNLINNDNKLPTEYGFKRALKIYIMRFALFAWIILGNILLFFIFWVSWTIPGKTIVSYFDLFSAIFIFIIYLFINITWLQSLDFSRINKIKKYLLRKEPQYGRPMMIDVMLEKRKTTLLQKIILIFLAFILAFLLAILARRFFK